MTDTRADELGFCSASRLLNRRALLIGGAAGLLAGSWAGNDRTVAALPHARQVPEPPSTDAAAVFAFDIDAGAELYALNPDQRRPTGSTVKIATALVVIANVDLQETVVIDASDQVDWAVYSHMGVLAGDTLSVEQLLYGLLLPSGSDAARALARHVGAQLAGGNPADADSSRGAFYVAMNELAAVLGLENSHFVNASGDDDPNQYSSARDLTLLATELLANPTLAEIVRTATWESVSLGPEQRQFQLNNFNKLLTEDANVIGVKTGSTPDAGTCLIAARRVGEANRVVTVVLGCTARYDQDGFLVEDGRWDATHAVVTAMSTEYQWVSLAGSEHLPGLSEELAVWRAAVDPAIAQPVPTASVNGLRYRLVLGPEADPGAEVGRIMLFNGQEIIGERPVFQAGGAL
jgi:D-alanyl-D-alanine carboxypeptidase (penicillin-binding protein 5/6)